MSMLEAFRDAAPQTPGVYLFKAADGTALYIGKAKNLRSRLTSHLNNPSTSGGQLLLDMSVEIDFIETGNEWEALLLEQKLISRHQPRFNVRLRFGRGYPYIAISMDEEFPRVWITREKHRRGRKYYGPYEFKYAQQLLTVLGKVFMFRSCEGATPGRMSGSPCLDYHIKRCKAPCVGYITAADYHTDINEVMRFLSGSWQQTLTKLQEEMKEQASQLNFEAAAATRDRYQTLVDLTKKQTGAKLETNTNADVIGVDLSDGGAHVVVLVVRGGHLQERRSYLLSNEAGQSKAEIVRDFLLRLYADDDNPIPSIIVVREVADKDEVCDYLHHVKGSNIDIRIPSRGQLLDLLTLAHMNASSAAQRSRLRSSEDDETAVRARAATLEVLQDKLGLVQRPRRIECYDISNLGPTHTVSAMVVFEDGLAKPADYRRFRVRSVQSNDFAALEEVLTRRVQAWRKHQDMEVDDPDYDDSFAATPDLILIDGGKGQLSSVVPIVVDMVDVGVGLASLAKQQEEVFLPGQSEPVDLPRADAASLLLQRVRDETHRFAITYHRRVRGRDAIKSVLDEIEGIGPKRRKVLLTTFETVEGIRQASKEELAAVLPEALAQTVYDYFH